jgi:hypothetical protein
MRLMMHDLTPLLEELTKDPEVGVSNCADNALEMLQVDKTWRKGE